jgi:hypothetical protein
MHNFKQYVASVFHSIKTIKVLVLTKLKRVIITKFKTLLHCCLVNDICCAYRLLIANLFEPYWPVTKTIFNLKHLTHLIFGPGRILQVE